MNSSVRDRANDIITRLIKLRDALKNAIAFRAMIEVLHARDLVGVVAPHAPPINVVRAGLLRGLIMIVFAGLDSERRDRASIPQILKLLEDQDVVEIFHAPLTPSQLLYLKSRIEEVRKKCAEVRLSEVVTHGRAVRDNDLAHLLVLENLGSVSYEAIYELHNHLIDWVTELISICGRADPKFSEEQDHAIASAKLFWDTYFNGRALGFVSNASADYGL